MMTSSPTNGQNHDRSPIFPQHQQQQQQQQQQRLPPQLQNTAGMTHTQKIPARFVPSTKRLVNLLNRKYGAGCYAVEMRHNVYTVTVDNDNLELSPADLETLCR